ncbi:hypothetical protein [Banduia mediterranea]
MRPGAGLVVDIRVQTRRGWLGLSEAARIGAALRVQGTGLLQ